MRQVRQLIRSGQSKTVVVPAGNTGCEKEHVVVLMALYAAATHALIGPDASSTALPLLAYSPAGRADTMANDLAARSSAMSPTE